MSTSELPAVIILDLLLAYWQGDGLQDRMVYDICRRLAARLKPHLPEDFVNEQALVHLPVIRQVLEDLVHQDPEIRALAESLSEHTKSTSKGPKQEITAIGDGNLLISAGRDLTLHGGIESLRQRISQGEKISVKDPALNQLDQEERVALRHILTEYFSAGELKTLCFDLGVDYEILPGEGKTNKAMELVAYFERRDHLGELIAACRQRRPNAFRK
jgi:hypothetical protein